MPPQKRKRAPAPGAATGKAKPKPGAAAKPRAKPTAKKTAVPEVLAGLTVGHAELQGERPTMEDALVGCSPWGVQPSKYIPGTAHLLGVFDGHGGREAADYTAETLPAELQVMGGAAYSRTAVATAAADGATRPGCWACWQPGVVRISATVAREQQLRAEARQQRRQQLRVDAAAALSHSCARRTTGLPGRWVAAIGRAGDRTPRHRDWVLPVDRRTGGQQPRNQRDDTQVDQTGLIISFVGLHRRAGDQPGRRRRRRLPHAAPPCCLLLFLWADFTAGSLPVPHFSCCLLCFHTLWPLFPFMSICPIATRPCEQATDGTTAVCALVCGRSGIAYVSNLGDSRAFVVKRPPAGKRKTKAKTVSHRRPPPLLPMLMRADRASVSATVCCYYRVRCTLVYIRCYRDACYIVLLLLEAALVYISVWSHCRPLTLLP